jgi:hypothetical protein
LANRLLKAMVTGSLSSQRIIWKPTKISFGGNYLLACTDRHWLYIYICSLYLLPSLQFAQLTYLRNMIGSTGIWTKLAQCNHKLLAREFLIDDVGLQAKCFHAVLFVEWISNSDCVCFVSRSISIEKKRSSDYTGISLQHHPGEGLVVGISTGSAQDKVLQNPGLWWKIMFPSSWCAFRWSYWTTSHGYPARDSATEWFWRPSGISADLTLGTSSPWKVAVFTG